MTWKAVMSRGGGTGGGGQEVDGRGERKGRRRGRERRRGTVDGSFFLAPPTPGLYSSVDRYKAGKGEGGWVAREGQFRDTRQTNRST